jgi:hypothetical protein
MLQLPSHRIGWRKIMNVMKNIIIPIVFICTTVINAQPGPGTLAGKVSFISSSNIYVRFQSTSGISAGDTLFRLSGSKFVPVLKVSNLSSTSCVCTPFTSMTFAISDMIYAKPKNITKKNGEKKIPETEVKETIGENKDTLTKKLYKPVFQKQRIRGSISAYTYFISSNTPATNYERYRYNLSLAASNISDSKFSVESYISFDYKSGDWSAVKSNLFNALKIYSLALKYDLNKTTQISIGRRINPKVSNIGAMDGLQFEKTINKFSLGLLAGTRPDFQNYGFNKNLFQYGAYASFDATTGSSYNQSSLAFMQQTNSGKTDRRFLYFQQSNSLFKNLYFFGTLEVDLYKLKNDTVNNVSHSSGTFDPTGIYLSLRYRMTRRLSLSGSYDARKNVMYYETYKLFIDRVLETEMRQGFRLQANYSITNNLMFGVTSGYRFLKSDPKPSKNVNGYLTYNMVPGINVSATLTGTYLESSYLNGKIYGISFSRDFFKGKLQTSIGYRHVDYRYPESILTEIQNIGEMNLYWLFAKKMAFSINYEGTFEKTVKYHMLFLQLRKSF